MKSCNTCKYINMTEREQEIIKSHTGKYGSHRCIKYNIRLLHGNVHPEYLNFESKDNSDCWKERVDSTKLLIDFQMLLKIQNTEYIPEDLLYINDYTVEQIENITGLRVIYPDRI